MKTKIQSFSLRFKIKGNGNKLFRTNLNIDSTGNFNDDSKLLSIKLKKFEGDNAKLYDFANLDDLITRRA